jgi:TrmH family RNA methyltransferase
MKTLRLTSRENPRAKHVVKLMASRDYRFEQKQYVLEGVRSLDGLQEVDELFVRDGAPAPSIKTKALYNLSPVLFEAIAGTEHSQGVIAVCSMPPALEVVDKNKRYFLLDRLQDPGNMGAIMRTACAFGFNGVLFIKGSADPFSPKVVRSAMGAEHITPIKLLQDLKELSGCVIIAADTKGLPLPKFSWPAGFVLCIGNEGNGISSELLSLAKSCVSIPIQKDMESLNAAVSAGILAYAASLFQAERNAR